MADELKKTVSIDDVVEVATAGVLRALEARNLNTAEFAQRNGFFVNINISAGGYPVGRDLIGGRGIAPAVAELKEG